MKYATPVTVLVPFVQTPPLNVTAVRGWGTAQLIGPHTGNSTNPRVAFDSTGRAIAVWEQIDAASNHNVWADLFD
jgi:hypothetical protein